jgi:subtilase-type serine protease
MGRRHGRKTALVAVMFLSACGGGGGTGSVAEVTRFALNLTGPALTQMQVALDAAFITPAEMQTVDFRNRLAVVRAQAPFAQSYNVNGLSNVRPLQASRLDWVRAIDRESGVTNGVPDTPDGLPDLTGAGVVLGMIDSPIRSTHEQFATQAGKLLLNPGSVHEADDEHGTFVASIMAGTGGTGGTAPVMGYAPQAQIYNGQISYQPGAVLNYVTLGGIMDGARAAGAVAVNNSWTVTSGGVPATVANSSVTSMGTNFSTYLTALQAYAAQGVVVFAQFNDTTQTSSSFLAGLPAEAPGLEQGWLAVINVAASYDPVTDRITGVARRSLGCLEAARWCLAATGYLQGADIDTNTDYVLGSGTSYAAPQVTGALGLLAQAFPGLTPAQLRNRLLASADNSFFTPTHVLEFVPGVEHGYNLEFGHGFLNVRDALLPIGETVTASAAGAVIPLEQVSLAGGMLAGDALAQGLAGVNLGFRDQLSGSFATPMAGFVATAAPVDVAAAGMTAWSRGAEGRLLTGPDGASVNGMARIRLMEGEAGWHLAALTDGLGRASGVAVGRDWDTGSGRVTMELSAMRGNDGLFGIDLGGTGAAEAVAATLGLRQELGSGIELALEGEVGRIATTAGGLVTDVSGLAYARAGVELAQRSVWRRGDRLSVFVETPLGAVAGQAEVTLPTLGTMQAAAVAADGAVAASGFDTMALSFVPEAREVDIGLEYSLPVSLRGEMVLGWSYRRNAGHVAGQTDRVAALGWRLRF